MPANTQTGEQLIDGLSEFIEDSWDRTSTSAGAADGTSVVDTQLAAFGEDSMADGWIRVTSGAASGEIQRVTSNTGSTVLVSPGFTTQILTSISYEFHRWNPETKFEVLDAARLHGFPHLSRVVFDETITTDGRAREFDLAGDLRKGPYFAWMEDPLTPDQQWNLLKTPKGDALTDWVLAGGAATAVLVSEEPRDRLIPKYDDFATKISVPDSTAVTYTQTVGTFDITAGDAAGRRMEFAKWVYCRTSGRVALTLTDDSGTTTSPFHQGLGWELLRVERDIDGDNATTLSVALSVSSGTPLTVFWNRAWFVFGEVPDCFLHEITNVRIRRDGSVQRALLDFPLIERRQLRLVGRGLLSALNASATATMEVDEADAELLFAVAARLLFQRVGFASDDSPELFNKIQSAEERMRLLDDDWGARLPQEPRIVGPHF